jgi:transposase-like protein
MTDTTTNSSSQTPTGPARTDSEVLEKAARRRFTAEYKQRILVEADACTKPGQISVLLRREGLYSSHLSKWREQREEAIRAGLSKPRGRPAEEKNPLAEENARLQQEIQRLPARLTQAQTLIDVQKNSRSGWAWARPA